MKRIFLALMYTALIAGANGAAADMSDISAMRDGDMKKLVFHTAPKPASDKAFIMEDGSEGHLSDYAGKIVLLNLWATWCAPCRKEMPMLAALQRDLGGDTFEVVTLAVGRNALPAMKTFFKDIGVDNLPLHKDPKQAIARDLAVLGLPTTILLNPEGQEIARLRGDADWASQNAKDVLQAVIAAQASGH